MKSLLRAGGLAAAVLLAVASLGGCASETSGEGNAVTTAGDLSVEGPWVVAPAAPNVTGAFATLVNAGADDVTLVSASSPIAGLVQVHETVSDGKVERMQEVAGGLTVPAGGSVVLKPGGYHVMLMQLKEVPAPGGTVELTFTFSDGTKITVNAPVRARPGMTGAPSASPSMAMG